VRIKHVAISTIELARDLRRPVSRDNMFPTLLLAILLRATGEASENVLCVSAGDRTRRRTRRLSTDQESELTYVRTRAAVTAISLSTCMDLSALVHVDLLCR
jgi:hypothetical protein